MKNRTLGLLRLPESARTLKKILAAGFFFLLFLPLSADFLTLEKALEIAFRNSPAMKEAALRLEISERNLKAEQSGLKSQFNLTVTPLNLSSSRVFNELTSRYNTQDQTKSEARFSITQPIKWTDGTLTISNRLNWQEASSSFTGGIKESTYSNSLSFRLSQPLFTYNRTQLKIEELELALENTQLNFTVQKLQIEKQVTQQFLNLFYNRESVKISQEEYKNADESYKIIESKVKAGISAPEELYQADVTRANSLASLENKQMQYENALDGFKILLGLSLSEEVEVVADIRKKVVEVELEKAIDHGLKYRMELRQQDIAIQNALNEVIRVGAQNEFKASVDISLGLTGTSKMFPDIYESPNTDKLLAVSLNIPIYDWGQKKHLLAASKAQVETQKLSSQEERKQIMYEIRQAYRSLQNQERQIEIAEKSVKNAQLTYEINLERYKNGDLSSKDMQFYQVQLSQQKLNEASALINYKLALLDLKIRSLWDFEINQSIVGTN